MKTEKLRRPPSFLEKLEARIAPAAIYHFADADGDAVTVSSSKGTDAELLAAIEPFLSAAGSGFQLQRIALNLAPAIFQGTTLVISAEKSAAGDGFIDVGYINATGLDLGSVTIDGDLGRIDAGNANVQTTGLKSLTAESLGLRGLATQGAGGSLESTIFGRVGALVLAGDLRAATFQVLGESPDLDPDTHSVLDAAARIGAVKIGGSVLGGAAAGSGQVFAKGRISTLEVAGSIVGGAGAESGRVYAEGGMDSATIEGSIVGGTSAAATNSGQLFAGGITTKIIVQGKLTGGAGLNSGLISNGRGIGSVTVGQGVEGGAGIGSGTIASAGRINVVTIEAGGVTGADGDESGVIRSGGPMQTVKINGDLTGGTGERSGAIGSLKPLGTVLVTGDVLGGIGDSSGQIVCVLKIKSVTVEGSVIGGAGFESGAIGSLEALGPVKIGGDLVGGAGESSGFIGSALGNLSGGVSSVASVTIGGDLIGGSGAGRQSGAIVSDGDLGPVKIGGRVIGGSADDSATIVGETFASVTIGQSLTGGAGQASGSILANVRLGPVKIGGDVRGGGGEFSGAVRSAGGLGAVTIDGLLAGGVGASSGTVETQGEPEDSDIGLVTIAGAILGGEGSSSGAVFSSGNLAGVQAAELRGFSGAPGLGFGSGSISSQLDMGPVKITGDITGGDGDESGKILAGGKLASLTVAGSLIGGAGAQDTTAGSLDQIGQIFAEGTLGAVKIDGALSGGAGAHSGQIRAASIKSITIGSNLAGGSGASSGGLVSTIGDIGPVVLGGSLTAGSAPLSGFITAAQELASLRAEALGDATGQRVRISALDEIKSIVVTESVAFTDIFAGMDIAGAFINPEAQIGSVTIGSGGSSFVRAMNIVAGSVAGPDAQFGTTDDQPIPSTGTPSSLSKISSVTIDGSILDEIGSSYGIVAEHVVRVKAGGQIVAQLSGPRNDRVAIGASSLFINEMELD